MYYYEINMKFSSKYFHESMHVKLLIQEQKIMEIIRNKLGTEKKLKYPFFRRDTTLLLFTIMKIYETSL